MKHKPLVLALAAALTTAPAAVLAGPPSKVVPASAQSVEFIGMPSPATPEERAKAYTTATVVVTYANGGTQVFPLSYRTLHYNTDTIGGVTAGLLYDVA